ncbi:MAG: TerC/Alx family metal homeostasis membrane protein [Polyangiaceae bacterium]|jgi:tellurite resistance protein TerC
MGLAQSGQGTLWVIFAVVVSFVVALDLGVLQRNPRDPSAKEALLFTLLWVGLATIFGGVVTAKLGVASGTQFFAAYLLEKVLSVDNLFVLILVFAQFKVPRAAQRKVLAAGVLGAVVLRTAFIVGGVTLVERFHVLTYLMGGFLIFAAAKTAFSSEEEEEEEQKPDGVVVRLARKVLPISDQMEGASFFVRREGKLLVTPLVLALVAVETADIVFAVDSIPAVFGVTKSAFIALTSNIFAILGLRSLYFLLQGALAKLEYLKPGLAAVLAFVGIKMVVSRWVEIPAAASLAVIVGILALATIASLRAAKDKADEPEADAVPEEDD